MASIKGPRSALTDFIEENNIKIQQVKSKKEHVPDKSVKKRVDQQDEPRKKKNKKIKKQMPVELINLERYTKTKKDIEIEDMLEVFDSINSLEDNQIADISSYLSRNRIHNEVYIKKFIDLCTDKLVIYDCSEIKDENYNINKNLNTIELYQCGQLSSLTVNKILRTQKNLEVLRLTGGYLITELELPSSLRILDLTHCSRVDDKIITEINKKCKHLEELKLSFCYKITGEIKLTVPVERLFLCETRVCEEFVLNIPKIEDVKSFSVKRCPLINNLSIQFRKLEYLNIQGITKIKNLNVQSSLKVLNCKQCFGLISALSSLLNKLDTLEVLNISYLPFKCSDVSNLKHLRELDISWCPSVTDSLVLGLVKNLSLRKIFVFGCFSLSPAISKDFWDDKDATKIFGNPAETKFLILNG